MKILYVITSLRIGGAEHLVAEMTERFIERGHQVDVCVFDGVETIFSEQVRNTGARIFALSNSPSYYNPIYIWKLYRLMKQYDIVHTHNSSPQLFTAIASVLCSVRLCTTEHNTSNRKRSWKWYAPIESWMYGRYHQVVCISKIAEDKLREYMGEKWIDKQSKEYDRISTINNGVDVTAIHNAAPTEELLVAKEERKAILMVAGFRPQKDQDTLVRALTHLDKDKFEVWFAGIGTRMEAVKALAVSLNVGDRVRFLGMRADVPRVIQAADVIVMSSHWEGLSLSNVEGMSAGKPFIASDVNGLREVTQGYGILFPHEDAQALANEIQRLHDNSEYYKQVADKCYLRALEFDIVKMIESYEQVYNGLATKA